MNNPPATQSPKTIFLALVLFGLGLALFFTFRYGGQWIETDTSALTRYSVIMQSEGALTPEAGAYQHGYLLQAFSALFSNLSGILISDVISTVFPLISILLLVVSAWYFYSKASRHSGIAGLAVLMLCFQPEVLFVIFRGSHEKLGWPLVMLSLALLYDSLEQRGTRLVVNIFLFYLVVFAHISTNIFFASTYMAAIVLSLLFGIVVNIFHARKSDKLSENPERLLYIGLLVSILIFIYVNYLYTPALDNLRTFESIYQQMTNLMVNPDSAAQPYEYIRFGWINTTAYIGVTLFTWLLILTSMLAWFWRGWRLLRGKDRFTLRDSLDWMLYAGFALQIGISIFVDFAGAFGGNFQLRVFPGFTVMAVLILSKAIFKILADGNLQPIFRTITLMIMAGLFLWLPLAGVLKASNEPLLSNQWMIYSEMEIQAVDWAVNHLENTTIWSGIDSRIRDAYTMNHSLKNGISLSSFSSYQDIRHLIYSQKDILRAERMGFPLPPVFGWLQVYDNGEVQFLIKPPLTPFQR